MEGVSQVTSLRSLSVGIANIAIAEHCGITQADVTAIAKMAWLEELHIGTKSLQHR